MAPRMRRDQRIRDTHRAQEWRIPPWVSANSPPHSSHLNGTPSRPAIPSFTYSSLDPVRLPSPIQPRPPSSALTREGGLANKRLEPKSPKSPLVLLGAL